MTKEDFIKMYKNTKKEEIIEELFYKCTANYRLNNIINELEKWLESEYKRYLDDEEDIISSNVEVIHYKRDLNKLKELKEESYNGKDNESTSK